jgi:adenine/guanine phosphoribosyltransferase-like PRPP-binding protein
LAPCIFEFVYLARPDSVIDGVSVYEARLHMGEHLADKLVKHIPVEEIDVVIPIPDSSRPSAMQLAQRINVPYREGFVKNRYIGRTFIMPGQATRKRSVRQKLNTVAQEFKGKRVLLVDDSIVRGTTSREIVEMARAAGALKVYFASASPPVRYPNVYGIDMPTRGELIATGRTGEEIAREIGADALVYQDLDALKASIRELKPSLCSFDTSCFDGSYITGDVSPEYLNAIELAREGYGAPCAGRSLVVKPVAVEPDVRGLKMEPMEAMESTRHHPRSYSLETLAVRAGQERSQFNEHSEALYLTSSFVFDSAAQAAARFSGEEEGNVYSRFTNPTVSRLSGSSGGARRRRGLRGHGLGNVGHSLAGDGAVQQRRPHRRVDGPVWRDAADARHHHAALRNPDQLCRADRCPPGKRRCGQKPGSCSWKHRRIR